MPEASQAPSEEQLPLPRIVSRRWVPSLVWLVPIAAALVGLSLLIHTWSAMGPRITISFQTAEGLEVGKTLVKFRNVAIGRVAGIALSPDHGAVLVTVELAKSAEDVARADTQFWVVRPRFGVGWVSGLDTLLSGAFIGVRTGASRLQRASFVGLEIPPPLDHGVHGTSILLHADDLGSVSLGAPVYFRRLQVGRVIDEQLEPDGRGSQLALFIDAPNDRFVTQSSRFWNSSGVDLSLGPSGLTLKTQSLTSVLVGGVAFETAPVESDTRAVLSGTQFVLFKDEAAAMAPPDGEPHYVRMRFSQSLRGLAVGAPVEFIGVNIGRVFSIDLDYDTTTQRFPVVVTAVLYPKRMGRAYDVLAQRGAAGSDEKMALLVGQLVAHGLRAQPRAGNLLTGQLYLALDFVAGAHQVTFNPATRPLEIPTMRGSIDELQLQVASIVEKIDALPLAAIARHADEDLTGMHATIEGVNGQVIPAVTAALAAGQNTLENANRVLADDSPQWQSLEQTLREARLSMRSIHSLADYLDRHPEALIRGRHAQSGLQSPVRTNEPPP